MHVYNLVCLKTERAVYLQGKQNIIVTQARTSTERMLSSAHILRTGYKTDYYKIQGCKEFITHTSYLKGNINIGGRSPT